MDGHERTAAILRQKQSADRPAEHLWVADEWKDFPVWRVPVDLLVLNADNRRFAAERKYFEAKLGRSLDPENSPDDALSIESILLDDNRRVSDDRVTGRPSKDTRALEEDLVDRKQERPLWIRPDGTVHNGNRRLAVTRRRRREGHEGTEWMDVIVIDPDEVNDLMLFRMEQHEQLTEDYKVRYTDVNLLLAIRDAAEAFNIDWGDPNDVDRVAGQLRTVMRNNKNYAVVQLYAIKYMEDFLQDVGQADRYELMLNQIERFRDIGKAMRTVARTAPDRELDMLDVCYAAVRGGISYLDIRKVRAMFLKDRDRFDSLVLGVREAEAGWEPSELGDAIHDPDVDGRGDEDDEIDDALGEDEFDAEDEDEPPGPNMPDYQPAPQVRGTFEQHIDGFEASQDRDSHRLLGEVLNRLEVLASGQHTILAEDIAAGIDGVNARFGEVISWVDQYRHLHR